MGFSIDNSGGGGRRGRRYGGSTLSEMNVVPLVDVVLVLLIIFMLTAQAMQFGLEIEVPKVSTERASAQDLNVVNITKTGELYFNEKPVNFNELSEIIKANKKVKENVVYIRADKATPWDPIAKVVSELTDAKIGVRMVTQTDDSRSNRR
ncbi:ExbD/TolR family protein [Bryobacter aggregatus]|uniref:ExbD/TolR family protein n=1 Tax=Bryobacter aggregatus TaxID=360054 RepID=UPI0004E13BC7|nr:biopolymer transporter ExbD [Bryobacter aggregatus]